MYLVKLQVTKLIINIQKSVVFLYTDNEISEGEIKETIPFTIIYGILYLQNEQNSCESI